MKGFGFRWDARSPSRTRAELRCAKRNDMFLKAAVNLNTKGNRGDARSHLMGISWCIFVLPSAVEAALNGKPARLQSVWAYYCTSKPFFLFFLHLLALILWYTNGLSALCASCCRSALKYNFVYQAKQRISHVHYASLPCTVLTLLCTPDGTFPDGFI